MSEVLVFAKVALKLILGSTALGAGATLVKKGIQDAAKVKLPIYRFDKGTSYA